jgi:beta-lactamase regulating signal transducer with metallopeptidase domain
MNVDLLLSVARWAGQQGWVDRFGWMLLHSLWQFALVAFVLGLALRFMIWASSTARYTACLVAMASMVLLPIVTWCSLPQSTPRVAPPVTVSAADGRVALLASQPVERRMPLAGSAPVPDDPAQPEPQRPQSTTARPIAQAVASAAPWAWRERLEPWLPTIVCLWLIGVIVFAVRPIVSWRTVRRLRANQTAPLTADVQQLFAAAVAKIGLRRTVQALQSGLVQVPAVIGYFRPVVLVPLSVAAGFPAEQLEALFAHELAHIRRHDYLVNLLQTAVETVFFYHPAIWWVSFQVRCEREDCCDDVAVAVCRSHLDYAKALVALEELRGRLPAMALAGSGGSLLSRIRRMSAIDEQPRPGLGSLVSVFAVAGAFAWASLPARTAQPAATRTPPAPPAAPSTASAPEKSAQTTGGQYWFTLPDGARFELLAVGQDPQDGPNWWRPDGSASAPTPDGELKSFEHQLPANDIRRGFAVNTWADPQADVTPPGVRGDSMSYGRVATENMADKVLRKHRFFVTLPPDARTTVSLNYAGGTWKTMSKVRPGGAREYPIPADDEGVAFDDPVEVNGSARVSAAFNVHADDVRIVAVDKAGRELTSEHRSGASLHSAHLIAAQFPGVPLASVREFRFQRRPFQHIEFRNVSLHAGQITHPEMFIDGQRFEPQAATDAAKGAAFAQEGEKMVPRPAEGAAPVKRTDADESAVGVTLPDGADLKLIGVNEFPAAGKAWWRGDGTPLANAPPGASHMGFTTGLVPNSLLRDFAFESRTDRAARVSLASIDGSVAASDSSGEMTSEPDGKTRDWRRVVARVRANSRATIAFDYAGGPWRTVSESSGTGTTATGFIGGGVAWDVASEAGGSARIVTAYDVDNSDVRLVALDRDGREHTSALKGGVSGRNARLLSVRFPGLALAQVKEFRFQTRPFQRIEFRNVSLHRGQKSKIEIYLDGKRLK